MPVPVPNLYPEFNIVRLSHACLNVSDLAASKRFYTDILGFDVTDETDSHIYLRAMEERGHHCLILQKSALAGTVEVMGYKTFDEADLDRAEAYFTARGRPTEWIERPYQGRTLLPLIIWACLEFFITRWTGFPQFTRIMPNIGG